MPGIRNLARLQTTVACAGAITPEAVADIKKMGFVSIVNLRLATEAGAEVEKEEAAAKAAGVKYFHVPFDGKPDPKAAGAFLDAITTKGAEPAFIHCAGRQSRGDDVADQAAGGRPLGSGSRGKGSDRARSDERTAAGVRDRVRARRTSGDDRRA